MTAKRKMLHPKKMNIVLCCGRKRVIKDRNFHLEITDGLEHL